MTIAEALSRVDAIYAAKRREAMTKLLTFPGDPDLDFIDEWFEQQDREYEETRSRLVAWLDSLPSGASLDAAES